MKRSVTLLALFAVTSCLFSQTNDIILPQQPKIHNRTESGIKDFKYWIAGEVEGASSVMEKKPNMQFATATVTFGYYVNEYFRVGLGFGGRVYVHNAEFRSTDRKFCFPIYANLRGTFLCKHYRKAAPYWSLNVGGVTDEGFFVNPTFGYSFGGLRNNFLLGISYTLNRFKDASYTHKTYSYLGIKLGYEF